MVGVVDVSEAARERETFRYDSSLIRSSVHSPPNRPIPASQLRSSPDAALTAFAQLAVLRLKATRALISLFDSSNQYVVAEATPDLSLQPASSAGRHPLWLSGTAMPRSSGICEYVLTAIPSPDDSRDGDALPVSVIADLAADSRFVDRPFVNSGKPQNRFYAGVPIRTNHGINIGVLCVFDNQPRCGLEPDDVCFMRELSNITMGHLESKRTTKSHRRTERMVRGISSFVDGSTTLTRNRNDISPSEDDQPLLHNFTGPQAALNDNERKDTSISVLSSGAAESTTQIRTPTASNECKGNQEEADAEIQINKIYTKAAKALRDSLDVEGIVFLDAHVTSFGGANVADFRDTSASSSSSGCDERISQMSVGINNEASELHAPILGFSVTSLSSIQNDTASCNPLKLSQSFLRKLLRRYPKGHIFNFNQSGVVQSSDFSSEETSADQSSSTRLDGAPKKRLGRQTRMKQSEQEMLMNLLPAARCVAFAPVWNPSSQRWSAGTFAYTKTSSRVFSSKGELNYLIAFGTIVVSEVSRLKATLADKSKMDMLSSLSHELRSPLHGVVLGVEILHDSPLDSFQKDLLRTVETCGRTLLDTVDHLLHWTKINNFNTQILARQRRNSDQNDKRDIRTDRRAAKFLEAGMINIATNVAVDALAEEVIESVSAGHTYQRLIVTHAANSSPTVHERTALRNFDRMLVDTDNVPADSQSPQPNEVVVSLDIEPNVDWVFRTQAGALRRILMNLLGNSLKYTTKGFIEVNLSQRASSPYFGRMRARRDTRIVCLTVSDSGKGISEDYLKNHLFVPFSQEDRLSPGVGLGLSLVKRIVSAFGGRVKVQSRLGCGTVISVELPLEVPRPNTLPSPVPKVQGEVLEDDFEGQIRSLRGRTVHLVGFTQEKSEVNCFGIPGISKQCDEHSALMAICRDWLHLNVADVSEDTTVVPDLVICSDAHLDTVMGNKMGTLAPRPVIVLCRNVAAAQEVQLRHKDSNQLLPSNLLEFSSQPVGPRKLARVLSSILDRWREHVGCIAGEQMPPDELNQELLPILQLPKGEISLDDKACNEVEETPPMPVALSTPVNTSDEVVHPLKDTSSRDRFLLVDDNPINLKILSSCMKRMGHLHDTARNGKEAVEAFTKGAGTYKCIFMDLSMPVMSGFEAACLIRQQERDAKLPACVIFALTGLASADSQQEAFASGIDLYLTKPVKFKELSQILTSEGLT